jgi:hypothetical protein
VSGSTSRVLVYVALVVSLAGEMYSYLTGEYVFMVSFLIIVVLLVAALWPRGGSSRGEVLRGPGA